MALSREQIFSADDIKTEEVDLPEWGGSLFVRGLTGQQRDEFEASIQERRGKKLVANLANIRARLVVWCAVDEKGDKVFNYGDVEELGRKSSAPIDRLYEAAARLSGLSEEDVDEMVENFGKTPGSDSPSTSQKRSARQGPNS